MHLKLLLLLFSCLGSTPALATSYLDHGEHRIHFTTFSSLIIPADVARAHGIVRSEKRIVLNLSVLKKGMPRTASISGHAINLLNQRFELVFNEVIEAEAVYYLASYLALEQDILRFNLDVQLNATASVPISFVRRYDQ
ncbi:DUF4426 domain-containing protein [Gammaproteobacteria bacterium]|nr:DUF4426 domain-containing protein [Gammaproteobacteria bacterium]